jgi:plastocyanin
MISRTKLFICCASGLALAAPGAAQAATKTVSLGPPGSAQAQIPKATAPGASFDVNAFFPGNITVRVGDTISFAVGGFHTVHFPARGKFSPSQLPTPAVNGLVDAAGVPFWFNGQQSANFNPLLFTSRFGKKTLTYSGAKEALSGLPAFGPTGPPKPLKIKFTKAGRFTYICDVHPGMKGTVRVNAKRKGAPSAAADAKRVKAQVASAVAVMKGLEKATTPAANTVSVGAEGKGGVTLFGMLPAALSVPAGTTVTFKMPVASTEVHTATFGPGADGFGTEAGPAKGTYVGDIAAAFADQGDARADFSSEAPGTPPAGLSPALHGNGFWNSGVMDAVSASPLPPSNAVTFSAPGVYAYGCLIHTNMKGTITVT